MGCNTSQELKTKDGSTAANNAANGSEQNEENVVTEQNANNEVEPPHNKSSGRTLSSASAISVTTQPPPSSSQPLFNHGNHTNHSKTNSIVSNGDAITIINRQSLTANTLKSTSLPAKENGSLPQAINGISVNYNINENDDNKFVSDKTEISELNGIEMGEDEGKASIDVLQTTVEGETIVRSFNCSKYTVINSSDFKFACVYTSVHSPAHSSAPSVAGLSAIKLGMKAEFAIHSPLHLATSYLPSPFKQLSVLRVFRC
uniref:Uncharacterized protein n=1 Tax=Glossina palpalis gambiensis TaxID=67801 RepID=A0A1B0C224_9MUSC